MSSKRRVLTLRLKPEVHRLVAIAASAEGLSMNEWIAERIDLAARYEVESFCHEFTETRKQEDEEPR